MQDKLYKMLPAAKLLEGQTLKKPTSPLAVYATEQFPADMALCVDSKLELSELARKHDNLLQPLKLSILKEDVPVLAAENQLDLVMLLGGYLLRKKEAFDIAPPIILELLKQNARQHGLAERMTYELIVDVNTEAFIRTGGTIRVFSPGEIGRIERDFYIGHHYAEKHCRAAYEAVKLVIDDPGREDSEEKLTQALQDLAIFTEYMSKYSALPAAEYAYFRRFLFVYPDGVKNASGAFMPSPQLLEMLLHKPAYAQTEYLTANRRYFSHWALPLFDMQMEVSLAGHNLEGLLQSEKSPFSDSQKVLLAEIVEQFIKFKLTHLKVISSKIPEAFPDKPILEREDLRGFCPFLNATRDGEGKQQGTGGFTPQDFLGDGVRRLLDLQQRLAVHFD